MATSAGPPGAESPSLYERDYYSWALEQERALREHRIEDLDWENLAEEVGDLARSERRAFRLQGARLVEHLLKFAFAPTAMMEDDRRLWKLSLMEARMEMRDLLTESPGLKPSIEELFAAAWQKGRYAVLASLDLADEAIAETPLWSFDQAMDDNFIPAR